MDDTLEQVGAARQCLRFELASRGDPRSREQDPGVGAFRDRIQAEDLVQLLDAAAAECRDLGKGVELATAVVGVDRAARREADLRWREAPCRSPAHGDK